MPLRYLLLALLLITAGCDRATGVKINGTVTLDDAPLPTGSIKFFYGDQVPAGIAEIKAGRFTCDCKPEGKMRVEITAIRDATQVDKAAGMGVPKVQYLPRRYNMDSELTADIAADATKELEFKLSSKP